MSPIMEVDTSDSDGELIREIEDHEYLRRDGKPVCVSCFCDWDSGFIGNDRANPYREEGYLCGYCFSLLPPDTLVRSLQCDGPEVRDPDERVTAQLIPEVLDMIETINPLHSDGEAPATALPPDNPVHPPNTLPAQPVPAGAIPHAQAETIQAEVEGVLIPHTDTGTIEDPSPFHYAADPEVEYRQPRVDRRNAEDGIGWTMFDNLPPEIISTIPHIRIKELRNGHRATMHKMPRLHLIGFFSIVLIGFISIEAVVVALGGKPLSVVYLDLFLLAVIFIPLFLFLSHTGPTHPVVSYRARQVPVDGQDADLMDVRLARHRHHPMNSTAKKCIVTYKFGYVHNGSRFRRIENWLLAKITGTLPFDCLERVAIENPCVRTPEVTKWWFKQYTNSLIGDTGIHEATISFQMLANINKTMVTAGLDKVKFHAALDSAQYDKGCNLNSHELDIENNTRVVAALIKSARHGHGVDFRLE
jgi:hypothetical protein